MNCYLLNFLIALLIADVLLFLCKKKMKPLYAKCGFLIVPTTAYLLFFNFNLGLIQNPFVYVSGYAGAIWSVFCFLLLVSFRRSPLQKTEKWTVAKVVVLLLFQLALVIVFLAVPWSVDTFPLSNPDVVLFALYAPIEGSNDFVMQSLVETVVKPSFVVFTLVIAFQLFFAIILRRFKVSGTFKLGWIAFYMSAEQRKIQIVCQIMKLFSFMFVGSVFVSLLIFPSIINSSAYDALFADSVDSPLYRSYYAEPQEASASGQKNLVVIFLESMTNNFKSFTPELNSWKEMGESFTPGGLSVSGTSWTIAGVTSALCGLPLNMPLTDDEYLGTLPTYLPNAICIMDLLNKAGYNQIYVQGSSAEFTQKRLFWTHHGNVAVHDDSYYKSQGRVPKNYGVFWGIEDRKTLSYFREELDSLSKLNRPFAMYYLSVDTHQPDGYLDSLCHYNEDSQYKNVLRCSSAMIGELLAWIKDQPWYENTVVVVVGDHTLQGLAKKAGLPQDEKLYTTAFLLNAGFENVKKQRFFSNLDYAPTILEAMGWNLPGHGFGLGRSLFSSAKTMLEIYGEDSLNAYLRQRSFQYDYFLFGK